MSDKPKIQITRASFERFYNAQQGNIVSMAHLRNLLKENGMGVEGDCEGHAGDFAAYLGEPQQGGFHER
jgi:hypothetical protein